MSPRRPPAPGTGGDPTGGSRPPRARADGSVGSAAKRAVAKKAPSPAAKKTPSPWPNSAEKAPVKKPVAKKAAPKTARVPMTPAEERAAAAKKRAAAQRARTVAAGSPVSHAPHKARARTTASRSGGLRPSSTRPGSPRPRAGSAGRGARKRGLGIGSGRPVWVLGAVGVVLALLILPYFQKWLVQRSELESVRADVSQAAADVSALKQQQERWKDEDYVRAQARARLDYVMPGDTRYAVADPTTPTPSATATPGELGDPDTTDAGDVPAGNNSWFSSVWQSAQIAGSEDEAQAQATPTAP
jgi:hypothetical protein